MWGASGNTTTPARLITPARTLVNADADANQMTQLHTETLLEQVGPDAPCGDDLSYDPAFMELERLVQGSPQDRIVGPDVAAEGPDWRVVRQRASALLGRTKDLRVAVQWTKALLHTDGWEGLREGTRLLHDLLVRYWDDIHPQLDPDFDFNPIMRTNALRELNDRQAVLNPVRNVPVVSLSGLGSFSLRDIALATGEIAAMQGATRPDMSKIDAAFDNAPIEAMQVTEQSVRGAIENVLRIESYLGEKVGAFHTVSFDELTVLLRQAHRLLVERMARRVPPPATNDGNGNDSGHGDHPATGSAGQPMMPHAAPAQPRSDASMHTPHMNAGSTQRFVAGEIRSREDVIRTLDALCDYYERHEPGSPVPMLLRRAQRLVPMSFVDIMRDLAPDAMSDIEKIRGPEREPQN
jgi:type VI secretion system protein ImpA